MQQLHMRLSKNEEAQIGDLKEYLAARDKDLAVPSSHEAVRWAIAKMAAICRKRRAGQRETRRPATDDGS